MKTFEEKTTLIGVSELRNNVDKILRQAKNHRVIIERRNKDIGVIMDINDYKRTQEILDVLEDFALGLLAQERRKTSELADYINIADAKKMI